MKVQVLQKNEKNEWIDFEVPPIQGTLTGLEAVRVTGRLKSTAGERAYNWKANFPLPTNAPYEPFACLEFRRQSVIRFLGWGKPSTLEYIPRKAKALSWGGKFVDTPALVWGGEVVDLSRREERKTFIETAHQAILSYDRLTQGSLVVTPLATGVTMEKLGEEAGVNLGEIVRYPRGPVVLYNHAVFVNRVVGYDKYRVVEIGKEGGVVTSPDHPFEPIALEEGLWLLEHPIPIAASSDVD